MKTSGNHSIAPCDPKIFRQGKPLLAADTYECHAPGFEAWVQEIARLSDQPVDWHYSGGVASVLYLGDRARVLSAIKAIPCPGRIMRIFEEGETGLYRAGVSPMQCPDCAGTNIRAREVEGVRDAKCYDCGAVVGVDQARA